ncbi:LOW QUALITY PROTEIN: DNA gyrase subunit A [Frankliniella fusca]|uniref:DNA gyrase subunit A n=1 Tax=Frankliniella fusca TaxID=407009 RepID=A0AAE1LEY4_9NEOP|nr:LOW QUALITY PROTEIN: DNA gyrase subunit A [Frankliniella fusca]
MDFMRIYNAVVSIGHLTFTLDSPDHKSQVTCPFKLQTSADVGKFGANSVFVVARSAVTIELQPFQSTICPAQLTGISSLPGDGMVTARVLRARCVLESDGSIRTMDGVDAVPMVPVVSVDSKVVSENTPPVWKSSTCVDEVTGSAAAFHTESVTPGHCDADRTNFGATPQILHAGDFNFQSRNSYCPNGALDREVDCTLNSFTLGLVQPSPLLDKRQCSLVPGVMPFAPGTLELELENLTETLIPRGSVVALVHPVGLVDLQLYEPLDPDDVPDDVVVESATIERVPLSDQADIQLEPRLPPIGLDEALPEDLQALADRKLKFLGFCLTEKGIGTDEAKVNTIVHWPTPRNCTEWDDTSVSAAQQADPDIGPIYQAVRKGERPHFQQIVGYGPVTRSLWVQFNSLLIEHGVLKRRFEHASGDPRFDRYQIVVPTDRATNLVL